MGLTSIEGMLTFLLKDYTVRCVCMCGRGKGEEEEENVPGSRALIPPLFSPPFPPFPRGRKDKDEQCVVEEEKRS